MIYNNETLLPYDAFKKDPLGRIKLHGGGDSGPPPAKPFDPTKDKGYIESKTFLDSLKKDLAKNNVKLTPEQIIAALTSSQRDIINQQANPLPVTDMSSWGQFKLAPQESMTTIVPQVAPNPTGQFAGVQSASPQLLAQLQAMLGQSNLLPTAAPPSMQQPTSYNGNIGG